MILADKIIELRKKNGWSQEELAEKLGVSRQAVSKWEGAQSVPDIQRILEMSRLFGVSTDYLLKDDMDYGSEAITESTAETDSPLRRVDMETASAFLAFRRNWAPRIALAVFLCIISPVALIMLGALSEYGVLSISENAAGGIGLIILLLLVAGAVSIFIIYGIKNQPYEFLEEEDIDTAYGVTGMVREYKERCAAACSAQIVLGVVLCILSLLPLFGALCVTENELVITLCVCLLLVIVAVGILFDIIGVAVTSADEKPFHSMASRRVPGAKEAIRLLRSAGKVSSICNDVVGDICGVVSGAASATIAARALTYVDFSWPQAVSLGMSALVAGLTVGGKAVGKTVAIRSCTEIVFTVGKFLAALDGCKAWLRRKTKKKKG